MPVTGHYAAQPGLLSAREYDWVWGFGAIRMNENDMDRYFWRSGRRWSGDDRPESEFYRKSKVPGPAIVFVFLSFIATLVGLVLTR